MLYRGWLVFVFLCLVGLCVYYNGLENPFHYDDVHHIVKNPHIRDLSTIPDLFTDSKTFSSVLASRGKGFHYRPLVMLSYALNYRLGELNPTGYHIVNLIFHVGASFLIFLIAKAILVSSKQGTDKPDHGSLFTVTYFSALTAGIVFLVHPFNSEIVNYISTRSSAMSGFFYLLAFYCWVRFRQLAVSGEQLAVSGEHSAGMTSLSVHCSPTTAPYFYIASLLAFVAGMLSKEVAITLPIVLWLYDFYFYYPFRPSCPLFRNLLSWRTYIPYLPFVFMVAAPYVIMRASWLGETFSHARRDVSVQLFTQIPVFVKHWKMFFVPAPLTPIHDVAVYHSFWSLPVISSSLLLLVYTIIAIFLPRRLFPLGRVVSFFMFWFFIVLLPTAIAPLGLIFQEHRGYLAAVSFAILTGVVLEGSKRFKIQKVVLVFLVMLIAAYSVVTVNRNRVWKDDLTLWTDTVRKSPKSTIAHTGLGIAYKNRRLYDQAIKSFQDALVFDDGEEALTARHNLAQVYIALNQWDMAAQELEKALKISPKSYQIHNDIGIAYDHLGQRDLAERHLLLAARLEPTNDLAYFNLGVFYSKQGKLENAREAYLKALSLYAAHKESARAHEVRERLKKLEGLQPD